ncbi:MAG: hypothetical protein J6U96_01740, partial [Elusimicrobiaceae bacterium]|nr:hypothetical protein [Elusimicrobiaceae bacterium]
MRYWVYINDKVVGPYDEEKLAELEGFTPDTLICTETAGAGGAQEWVKASSVFDFDEAPQTPPQPMNVASSAAPAQSQGFDSNALAAQLLAKIDQLTQEIEGMKGRLNEAVSAQEATSERLNELASRPVTPAERPIPAETPINETPLTNDVNNTPASVTDDAVVTSTDSLVQQAEQVVADAQHTEKKPVDFLDEIQIGENKDNLTEKSKGEDVVLLSALDSLYNSNVKEQTEEEKEQTFQDLLSPVKQAATAAAAGAAVTAAAASLSDTKQQPVEQTPAQQDTTPLTPQQREDLINEITTPVTQTDAISQAIDQAQQVQPEQYVTEVPVLDESVTAVQEVVQEAPVQEVPADVPTLDETAVATQEVAAEETPVQEAPADVPALDESAVATQEVVQETEAEQTPTNVISLDESEEAAEELVAQENLVEQTSEQAPA